MTSVLGSWGVTSWRKRETWTVTSARGWINLVYLTWRNDSIHDSIGWWNSTNRWVLWADSRIRHSWLLSKGLLEIHRGIRWWLLLRRLLIIIAWGTTWRWHKVVGWGLRLKWLGNWGLSTLREVLWNFTEVLNWALSMLKWVLCRWIKIKFRLENSYWYGFSIAITI